MMMGTADEAPTAPATAVVFVEDLPEAKRRAATQARGRGVSLSLALPLPPLGRSELVANRIRSTSARGWRTWATRAT